MGVSWAWSNVEEKERTFAVDPQERRGLPLFENTALEEPGRCSLMVGLACDIMVCGRIWRREPVSQILS
jgi:hypothetical protein